MEKIKSWISQNKILTVILVLFGYFLVQDYGFLPGDIVGTPGNKAYYGGADYAMTESMDMAAPSLGMRGLSLPVNELPPQIDVSERKITRNSQVSMVVEDVEDSLDVINKETSARGGFMVNTSVTSPEEGGTGYIVVRVPAEQLDSMLTFLETISVRVVSQQIQGRDVTDQFEDIQTRLETLESNKSRIEQIMDQAIEVEDILSIQQQLFQIQNQIDYYKGRLQYIEETTSTSEITVNLSTDELSLPYAPGTPWRPSVVFKTAVRELNLTLRNLAENVIYLGVYSVLWVPALGVGIFVKKKYFPKKEN